MANNQVTLEDGAKVNKQDLQNLIGKLVAINPIGNLDDQRIQNLVDLCENPNFPIIESVMQTFKTHGFVNSRGVPNELVKKIMKLYVADGNLVLPTLWGFVD